MVCVNLRIDASNLRKLQTDFARMQKTFPLAIARGLNEGGDLVRTQVQRAMREQTGLVRLKSVTSRMRTARAFAAQGDLSVSVKGSGVGQGMRYQIIFTGKPPTKPDEFRTRVKRGPGGGVTVWMWGVAHTFPRSFQQAYKEGLRMRLGGPRLPIRGFDGPNLAKEAQKDQVAATFMRDAAALVPPMIEKNLAKMIHG